MVMTLPVQVPWMHHHHHLTEFSLFYGNNHIGGREKAAKYVVLLCEGIGRHTDQFTHKLVVVVVVIIVIMMGSKDRETE
jgi:hypothetical protein